MKSCKRLPTLFGRASVLAVCLALLTVTTLMGAKRPGKSVIQPIPLDPAAPTVELFAGMEQGQLDVTMIQQNALKGNLLLENTTDEPLTVELPEAFVGVQILKQFGGGGLGGLGGIGGGGGGGGGAQRTGGGGGGGGGGGDGGGGIFSIPPDKIVRVSYNSVCLEHGKTDPIPSMRYRPIPVEEHSDDPVLHELLKLVGSGRINPKVAQAAAWNIANGMSWAELSAKPRVRIGGAKEPYFSRDQLAGAHRLVSKAAATARVRAIEAERNDNEEVSNSEPTQPRSF